MPAGSAEGFQKPLGSSVDASHTSWVEWERTEVESPDDKRDGSELPYKSEGPRSGPLACRECLLGHGKDDLVVLKTARVDELHRGGLLVFADGELVVLILDIGAGHH